MRGRMWGRFTASVKGEELDADDDYWLGEIMTATLGVEGDVAINFDGDYLVGTVREQFLGVCESPVTVGDTTTVDLWRHTSRPTLAIGDEHMEEAAREAAKGKVRVRCKISTSDGESISVSAIEESTAPAFRQTWLLIRQPLDRILFLDVDGVLNSASSRAERQQQGMSLDEASLPTPESLALLVRLVRASGCAIVLSSTWREAPHDRAAIAGALRSVGLFFIDGTPLIDDAVGAGGRVDEILAWLKAAAATSAAWLALDDLDMHGWRPELNANHFELTVDSVGLSDANVDSAIAKLRGQSQGAAFPES